MLAKLSYSDPGHLSTVAQLVLHNSVAAQGGRSACGRADYISRNNGASRVNDWFVLCDPRPTEGCDRRSRVGLHVTGGSAEPVPPQTPMISISLPRPSKSSGSASRAVARWQLVRFYEYAAEAEVSELTRLATTVSRWEAEILNFHVTRISTGPVEAQNLVTEKIRRIAHGIRNFQNYRLRLLLHSGVQWDTRPTARIRGRHPRLIA